MDFDVHSVQDLLQNLLVPDHSSTLRQTPGQNSDLVSLSLEGVGIIKSPPLLRSKLHNHGHGILKSAMARNGCTRGTQTIWIMFLASYQNTGHQKMQSIESLSTFNLSSGASGMYTSEQQAHIRDFIHGPFQTVPHVQRTVLIRLVVSALESKWKDKKREREREKKKKHSLNLLELLISKLPYNLLLTGQDATRNKVHRFQ